MSHKPKRTVFDAYTRQLREVDLTDAELESHEAAAKEADKVGKGGGSGDSPLTGQALQDEVYRMVDEALKERGL